MKGEEGGVARSGCDPDVAGVLLLLLLTLYGVMLLFLKLSP